MSGLMRAPAPIPLLGPLLTGPRREGIWHHIRHPRLDGAAASDGQPVARVPQIEVGLHGGGLPLRDADQESGLMGLVGAVGTGLSMYRFVFAAILGLASYGMARADAPPTASGSLFAIQPMTWAGFYLGGVAGYGSTHF